MKTLTKVFILLILPFFMTAQTKTTDTKKVTKTKKVSEALNAASADDEATATMINNDEDGKSTRDKCCNERITCSNDGACKLDATTVWYSPLAEKAKLSAMQNSGAADDEATAMMIDKSSSKATGTRKVSMAKEVSKKVNSASGDDEATAMLINSNEEGEEMVSFRRVNNPIDKLSSKTKSVKVTVCTSDSRTCNTVVADLMDGELILPKLKLEKGFYYVEVKDDDIIYRSGIEVK